MNGRVDELRRLIALYRLSLAEGVGSDLARKCLNEIAKAEAELARIEKDGSDPDPGPGAKRP